MSVTQKKSSLAIKSGAGNGYEGMRKMWVHYDNSRICGGLFVKDLLLKIWNKGMVVQYIPDTINFGWYHFHLPTLAGIILLRIER